MARIIYKDGCDGQRRLGSIEGIEIDELARGIDGADLLEDFYSIVCSCSLFHPNYGWIAYGNYGYANGGSLCSRYVAAPLILLDAAADGVTATARKTNIKKRQ